ncbi:MAG: 4'-phosphopantetheinyl transferase superfamily protein [Desulfobacteraceae bacterium]|nr:MAG: 4'-phosphopantetheinyl transferase superfamily protein [Desulfobacteraceae bacterium]
MQGDLSVHQPSIFQWKEPPDRIELQRGSIHIWRMRIKEWISCLKSLEEILSQGELSKLQSAKNPSRRVTYTIGRGILRMILERYTGINPSNLDLYYGPSGKPALSKEKNCRTHSFSLSHSGEWLIIAIGMLIDLGIDVEFKKKSLRALDLSERFFSRCEALMVKNAEVDRRTEVFYRIWVRKEACLKALGIGLVQGIKDVRVCSLESPSILIMDDLQEGNSRHKTLICQDLFVAPEYASAIASWPPATSIFQFDGYRTFF